MTEQEWNASEDVGAMLEVIRGPIAQLYSLAGKTRLPSDRKLRLFAVAVSRLDASRCPDVVAAQDFAEAMADGGTLCSSPYWVTATEALSAAQQAAGAPFATGGAKAAILRDLVGNPFRPVTLCGVECPDPEEGYHAPGCPLTPLVLRLAEAAYAERPGRRCGRCGGTGGRMHRPGPQQQWVLCPDCHGTGRLDDGTLDPARLQVLADALEEGCDNADLLAHLRGPGPHWRGCWAVDLILGKE